MFVNMGTHIVKSTDISEHIINHRSESSGHQEDLDRYVMPSGRAEALRVEYGPIWLWEGEGLFPIFQIFQRQAEML
jgi:hypothetical protein